MFASKGEITPRTQKVTSVESGLIGANRRRIAPVRWGLFGVSQSACAAKTREIRRIFDIVQLDPRWCLPSKLAESPLVWMIPVNGVVVDIRMMPREFQEQAYQLGLIPFVPGTGSA
jgi:hypothetical protein